MQHISRLRVGALLVLMWILIYAVGLVLLGVNYPKTSHEVILASREKEPAWLTNSSWTASSLVPVRLTKEGTTSIKDDADDPDARLRQPIKGPCAINLFGLPRHFQHFTLPSLIQHVIRPNAVYRCDYYVHYYQIYHETLDRGVDAGRTGPLDPDQIRLLEHAVHEIHAETWPLNHSRTNPFSPPRVRFRTDTEQSFRKHAAVASLLGKLFSDSPTDRQLYWPVRDFSYTNNTVLNVIKMWHSCQAVWEVMVTSAGNRSTRPHYSRVAMLRSDVLYVTPLDIYQLPNGTMDIENQVAVVPDFAKFPVNDRLIYGPYDAVRIWAAGRYERCRAYVHRMARLDPGIGLHSEKFMDQAIFPSIRDAGVPIGTDPRLCFLRVRADATVRLDDCGPWSSSSSSWPSPAMNQVAYSQRVVESLIRRPCFLLDPRHRNHQGPLEPEKTVQILYCPLSTSLSSTARPNQDEPLPWSPGVPPSHGTLP